MKKFASKLMTFLTALLMTLSILPMTAFAAKQVTLVNPLDETDTRSVSIKDDTKVVAFWLTSAGKIEEGTPLEFTSLAGGTMVHGTENNPVVYYILDDITTRKMNISSGCAYIVGAGDGITITRDSEELSDLLNTTNDSIDLTIMNLTFDGNNAAMEKEVRGGLLAANGGSIKLENVTFRNNGVAHEYGLSQSTENPGLEFGTGAVRIAADTSEACSVTMEGCTVEGNTSLGNGAGIFIGEKGTLTLQGENHIQGNESLNVNGKRGAGIYMEKNATLNIGGDLTVSGNKINSAGGETSDSDIYVNGNKINVTSKLTGGDDSVGIDDSTNHGSNNIFAKGSSVNGDDVKAEDGESAAAFFRDNCEDGCHVHRTASGVYFCTENHTPVVEKYTHILTYHANDESNKTEVDKAENVEADPYEFTVKGCMFSAPEGFVFKGWSENAQGTGTIYSANDSISVSGSEDLYAIWEEEQPDEKTVVLTYDANNGTEEKEQDQKTVGVNDEAVFTVAGGDKFDAPEGKEFQEWNTKADGTGTTYAPTATLTTGESLTLYAIWKTKTSKTSYPGLEKYIVTDDEKEVKSTSVNAGDEVNFKLISNVPQDLLNYLKPATPPDQPSLLSFNSNLNGDEYYLEFHDVMDEELEYVNGSIKVLVNNKEVSVTPKIGTDADGKTTIDVKLELVSLYHANYFTKDEFGSAPIVLTYTASAADLKAGKYYNKAWVEYEGDKTKEDSVVVNTYGINIFKCDQADKKKGLSGAKFTLYRVEEDSTETVIQSGITSGEDGYARYDGLKAGTYKLYETEAPENYVKSEVPLTITIPDNADSSNIASAQFANAEIPHTGGNGTGVYTIAGIGIILAAGLFLLITRKKKGQEN